MNKRIPIIIGLILTIIAAWLLITPAGSVRHVLGRLENLGYDIQLRANVLTGKSKLPQTPVAIIDIDDKSIKAEGRWPWPRSKLALLMNKLQQNGVAVIAFDIFFPEKQANIADVISNTLAEKNLLNPQLKTLLTNSQSLFDEDTVFSKSIAANQTVLSYTFLPRTETQNILGPPLFELTKEQQTDLQLIRGVGYISNIPILQQAAKGAGFINIFPDDDGIVRRAPLVMEYKKGVYPAISLQAVLTYLGEKAELITPYYDNKMQLEGVRIGNHVIPTDARGFVLIPFVGRSYTFPYFSATDVLHDKVPANLLLGKIVFVGTSATGLGDLQPTAIENPFPGVEIQASLVNGILLHHFSYRPAWTIGANIFITVLFGVLAAFIFPYLGPRLLGLTIVLFPMGLLYVNNLIWSHTGLILAFLMPVMLVFLLAIFNIVYGYLFETRRREQLKEMFGQYVPETHINEMLKSKARFGLRGENRDMTVMFADIRNFTSISEGMTAVDLVDMLNLYFTPMTEIIHRYVGTVDKYIGDLIMAFWGAPLPDKKHAYHALCTAIDMQKELKELRLKYADKKWPEIIMGIGINSGRMSVGDMGSRFRRNYTVLGDSVNLASRIESLTKFYGVNILVTENTQKDQSSIIFRKIDRVQVKGKKNGIDIYEVIDFKDKVTQATLDELAQYHQALTLYDEKRWDEALAAMTNLNQLYPERKIYSIYIERIKGYSITPPPADWDGTYVHLAK